MDSSVLAFPAPLPGEFFGSILLRYQSVYGTRRLSYTLCNTLGLGRGAVRHLPTQLGQLADRLVSIWAGGVDEILEAHTVWPVYRPFLTRHTALSAHRRIVEGPPGSLQLTLGDAPARLSLPRHLQACVACFAEDSETYGVGYLHTEHQLPGVRACHWHDMGLVAVPFVDGTDNRLNIQSLSPRCARRDIWPGEVEFARLSAKLLTAQVPCLTPELLAFAYSERLMALNLLTKKGYVRTGGLVDLVLDSFPETMLGRIGVSRAAVQSWMPRMLHRVGYSTHPLKHLLYIGALFGTVENFVNALPLRELPFNTVPPSASRRDIKQEIAEQLAHHRKSMTAISRRLGISVDTVIVQAKRVGIEVDSRPKYVGARIVKRIEMKAAKGVPVAMICESEQVSASTVYRTIQANRSVESARRLKLEANRRKLCRRLWQKQLVRADARRTIARSRAPAIYAWLYRHDRSWLMR
jgi:hypothetical protein